MERRNFFKVLGALFVAPATLTLGAVAVKPKARMIPEWSGLEITGTDAYGDAQKEDVWVFQKSSWKYLRTEINRFGMGIEIYGTRFGEIEVLPHPFLSSCSRQEIKYRILSSRHGEPCVVGFRK